MIKLSHELRVRAGYACGAVPAAYAAVAVPAAYASVPAAYAAHSHRLFMRDYEKKKWETFFGTQREGGRGGVGIIRKPWNVLRNPCSRVTVVGSRRRHGLSR